MNYHLPTKAEVALWARASRNRYIHRWHTPIVVKLHGVDENWWYAPDYNKRYLPVITRGGNDAYNV